MLDRTVRNTMHTSNCKCQQCRNAAAGFEFEMFEANEPRESASEQEEYELALELLSVQNEQELEQFLGDVLKKVGSGLQQAGSFAMKNVIPVLGPALKQVAKAALPLVGGAAGSLIPIPGVGTALGSALGGAVANALERETAHLGPGEADIERARRFIRLARSAIRNAARAPGSVQPELAAQTALGAAALEHLPSAAPMIGAELAKTGQPSSQAGAIASSPAPSGIWRRH